MGIRGVIVIFVKRYFVYFWLLVFEVYGVFILKGIKKFGFIKYMKSWFVFKGFLFKEENFIFKYLRVRIKVLGVTKINVLVFLFCFKEVFYIIKIL